MLCRALSPRLGIGTPAPRQDLSPAALESQKAAVGLGGRRAGGGSERSRSQRGGEASLRAKMATLGCRRGLCHAARVNPPKRHAGKGEGKTAPGELVRWGRAAAGSGGQRSPGWPRCWGRAARESRKCPLCEAGQRDFRRGELGLVPPSPPPPALNFWVSAPAPLRSPASRGGDARSHR